MARITLTIDNGPHPTETPDVLSVLAEREVPAYFFIVGAAAAKPGGLDILDQIAAGGHVIGNHTWSHRIPFGDNPDPNAVAEEVERTADLLKPWTADPPLFRPFGGGGRLDPCLFSPALIDHLVTNGYTCALWNNVPRDWEDPDGWVNTALTTAGSQAWSVVVVHDYLVGAAPGVSQFIDRARKLGHEFTGELAETCTPIVAGAVKADLAPLTTPYRTIP
jgi:peptidoglycan/xylan/chitin deacetylase (PgdA/CDA1 family)